jgi:N-methylhydantoinase A/oxoprolinase/acetone carboxylase beta subunit
MDDPGDELRYEFGIDIGGTFTDVVCRCHTAIKGHIG